MTKQALSLKNLMAHKEIIRAPGAFDSLSAKIIQAANFPAIYMTGFGATASRLGEPDIGLLTQTEMCSHARDMSRAVSIPIIADADTGYGGPNNIERTVLEYIQCGVAAIHLEDQVAPKRCGQLNGIRLMDAKENASRLKCAVAAKHSSDLVIIGRTDALSATGMSDAIDRAKRYQDAGVDLVFIDGIKTVEQVETVARKLEGPKVVSIVDGNESINLTGSMLEELGFKIVLYAVTALFAATKATQQAVNDLANNDAPRYKNSITYADFSDLVGLARHQAIDQTFGV
jgi:2-methylisocitrate lyase-like PEP mutase family enzyme